jgi:hypothetical protein
MKTFITTLDGKVDQIIQTAGDDSPGNEWIEVAFNFLGRRGDKYPDWFKDGQRVLDDELVAQGKRIDSRGKLYKKDASSETRNIYSLDEEAGEDWTREPPLENEPCQKFDRQKNKWVVDIAEKEKAEKENVISKIQSNIEDAERRIQRSTRAKLIGNATMEDEQYFTELGTEIDRLREEKRELLLSA